MSRDQGTYCERKGQRLEEEKKSKKGEAVTLVPVLRLWWESRGWVLFLNEYLNLSNIHVEVGI